jgi:hypothetical protein
MSSFSSRPLQIWRSSLADSLTPIRGAFAFEVLPSIMVPQTLQFLSEQLRNTEQITSPTISGFIYGMNYYSDKQPNTLWYLMGFHNAAELFSTDPAYLSDAITQLEIHTDINLTFSRVVYLADVGVGPTQPLLIIERRPFFRGVGFEIEERGQVTASFKTGDFQLSQKAVAAQHHYSTGLALLAAEDQISGLLDAAFMQFYLAIECVLDAHEKSRAQSNGDELFPSKFTGDLRNVVGHVYIARHRFFGHGHPNQQKAHSDSDIAFAIAKQTLVARWCARTLISLELDRELVTRETRLYSGSGPRRAPQPRPSHARHAPSSNARSTWATMSAMIALTAKSFGV